MQSIESKTGSLAYVADFGRALSHSSHWQTSEIATVPIHVAVKPIAQTTNVFLEQTLETINRL